MVRTQFGALSLIIRSNQVWPTAIRNRSCFNREQTQPLKAAKSWWQKTRHQCNVMEEKEYRWPNTELKFGTNNLSSLGSIMMKYFKQIFL